MAPHSSILAWKIPWMEELGGLQSMGSRSRTRLSNFTFTFRSHALEKEMATHSGVLAWRIPGTEEPGRLPSLGSHRVRHNWSNLAAASIMKHCWCLYMFYKNPRPLFMVSISLTSLKTSFIYIGDQSPLAWQLFVCFKPHHGTCGILVPYQGLHPGTLQWESQVITTGLPGNSLTWRF